ncbi:MAG: hypothetical protein LBN00_05045, partial [Oscillospiraceae bacterium]|nr:hypothetical protein [Oscillospiraceae bacterium]
MKKLVCFTGVEAPGGRTEVGAAGGGNPPHSLYWAIVDGELRQVKVLAERDLLWFPGFAVWVGVFECDFEQGFITHVGYAESIVTGYSVAAPKDGEIVLGVEETAYKFAPNTPAYIASKGSLVTDFKSTVGELEASWDDNWFLKLNGDGAIETMWVVKGGGGESPQLAQIKRFRAAWGPAAENGLAIEYNYYAPPIEDGVKKPLFIWFHGLHGGTSTWTNLFEFNPISTWTEDAIQSQFPSGGAYLMTPRANEDLRPGHGLSWNAAHVAPFFAALDDFLAKNPNIDEKRVYVGGFSMGGGMTWL